jgi:hypothetical protein
MQVGNTVRKKRAYKQKQIEELAAETIAFDAIGDGEVAQVGRPYSGGDVEQFNTTKDETDKCNGLEVMQQPLTSDLARLPPKSMLTKRKWSACGVMKVQADDGAREVLKVNLSASKVGLFGTC